MKYLEQQPIKSFLLRLFTGEDIIESLIAFCKHHPKIGAGSVQGIGAVSAINIGYYNGSEYQTTSLTENLEIVSLIGNIAKNHVVHLHGIFAREDGSCVGGHVFPGCIVSFTCEIQVLVLEPELIREFDEETNLNLLSLPHELN